MCPPFLEKLGLSSWIILDVCSGVFRTDIWFLIFKFLHIYYCVCTHTTCVCMQVGLRTTFRIPFSFHHRIWESNSGSQACAVRGFGFFCLFVCLCSFFDRVPNWTPSSSIMLCWLANGLQGPTCIYPPWSAVTDPRWQKCMCCHAWLLHEYCGAELLDQLSHTLASGLLF